MLYHHINRNDNHDHDSGIVISIRILKILVWDSNYYLIIYNVVPIIPIKPIPTMSDTIATLQKCTYMSKNIYNLLNNS